MEQDTHNSFNSLDIIQILTDITKAVVIYSSRDLHIGFINKAMMKMWEKETSLTGKRLGEVAPEFTGFIPILEEVWDTGETYVASDQYANIDDHGVQVRRMFDFTFQPIVNEQGKTYAIVNTAVDVTERFLMSEKVSEKEVMEHKAHLLLQQSNENLQKANKKLASLNQQYLDKNDELNATLEKSALINEKFNESNHALISLNDELESSKRQLSNALQAASLGSYDLDVTTGLMECSDQCKLNFGVRADERFDFEDLISSILPEYRQQVQQSVNIAFTENKPYNTEYQIKRPDGTIQWIQANGTPRFDSYGNPSHMIGVTQLVTDQKNYQARKDEFLSVASHELKTPITVLKANLQLLDRLKPKLVNATATALIESCTRSMDKIDSMLNDLLDISRYSNGRIELHQTEFEIYALLTSCISHLSAEQKSKVKVHAAPLTIKADQNRIEQVLVNFINNAYKYAPDSSEIELSAVKEEDYIVFAVQDYGTGIPEDEVAYVFDRYWQSDKKQTFNSGVGLGLYISAEIVKRHQGFIGVESSLGKGSRFWFKLPLTRP